MNTRQKNTKKISGLYAIVENSDKALELLNKGIKLIQLRHKNKSQDEIIEEGLKINSYKKKHDFIFIINDNPAVALEINADGVHLGQNDMPVSQARNILGENKIIGLSTHSLNQIQKALKQPIDYLACGAVFKTFSKSENHPVIGLELLSKVVSISSIPVVAIGGINNTNFQSVLNTGVDAIASISGIDTLINIM